MNFCESTTRTIWAITSSRIAWCCARRSSRGICLSLTVVNFMFSYSFSLCRDRHDLLPGFDVYRAARLASALVFSAVHGEFETDSTGTHPASHPRRVAIDQSIVGDVASHYRARANEGVPADRGAANNRAVSA